MSSSPPSPGTETATIIISQSLEKIYISQKSKSDEEEDHPKEGDLKEEDPLDQTSDDEDEDIEEVDMDYYLNYEPDEKDFLDSNPGDDEELFRFFQKNSRPAYDWKTIPAGPFRMQ